VRRGRETGHGFTTEAVTPIESDNLRHSCVTLLLRPGAPPHNVQPVVRHANIHVTMMT
jgi:site-specific recombinase XerD